MKITVFTSNQPRHLSFIESLSKVADTVFAVQEITTIHTGSREGLYRKSEVMERYFSHVHVAERKVFGDIRFVTPASGHVIYQLAIGLGDLNELTLSQLEPALQSDVYVVFGASYIKGELCDFLVKNRAYNIHMGISPQYRGSSCNFWAVYDGKPEYVGATIHLLSKGLDSGDILFHARPESDDNPFVFTMNAVKAAHDKLVEAIADGSIATAQAQKQDRSLEIRYSKTSEFTDGVAEEFLQRYHF